MKTFQKHLFSLACLSLAITGFNAGFTQQAKMSFSSAYSMLNGNSSSSGTGGSSGSMGFALNNSMAYSKRVTIFYGIPIEIVMEYAAIKANLASDLASNPETYDNSTDEVQQALVNIAYGDFVKISDYNQVNVKLNFRFNPPVLRIYGSDEGDFVNSSHSSPYDPGVYITPNTPVRGSKIMVIKK
jgi:hypothetical protein